MRSKGTGLLIIFCLLIIISLLFPVSLSAAGVGIAPRELNFNIHPGGSANETLYVINTGSIEARYKVYVEEGYKDWFDIVPGEFTLAPGGFKEVEVIACPSLFARGDHAIQLYVAATNPSPQLGTGAGIKVPVHLHVASWPLYTGIGIAAALLATLTVFLIRRRRMTDSAAK
jgi:hypothetical protein